jgi:hypothetical protein
VQPISRISKYGQRPMRPGSGTCHRCPRELSQSGACRLPTMPWHAIWGRPLSRSEGDAIRPQAFPISSVQQRDAATIRVTTEGLPRSDCLANVCCILRRRFEDSLFFIRFNASLDSDALARHLPGVAPIHSAAQKCLDSHPDMCQIRPPIGPLTGFAWLKHRPR